MIALFTDFGADGPYVGQMKAALHRHGASAEAIVDLLHSAPAFDAQAGAHLLAALAASFDPGTVMLAVVDAGVGSAREPIALTADGRWYVGPDNGLLSVVAARAADIRIGRIGWRPQRLSTSFHGRDLFAPVAALIASGRTQLAMLTPYPRLAVDFGADDLAQIIYIDGYGNAMTGMRAGALRQSQGVRVAGRSIPRARVFSDRPKGSLVWYENSSGLVEIAANQASAAAMLGLTVGDCVELATDAD